MLECWSVGVECIGVSFVGFLYAATYLCPCHGVDHCLVCFPLIFFDIVDVVDVVVDDVVDDVVVDVVDFVVVCSIGQRNCPAFFANIAYCHQSLWGTN